MPSPIPVPETMPAPDPETLNDHWSRVGPRGRAFLLACLEGESPRGREWHRTVALLLKRRLYRYLKLTPLGREVAEHGRAQG